MIIKEKIALHIVAIQLLFKVLRLIRKQFISTQQTRYEIYKNDSFLYLGSLIFLLSDTIKIKEVIVNKSSAGK